MIVNLSADVICTKCHHLKSWHHAKQRQKKDGKYYIRTCYGIACTCDEKYNMP